MEDDIDFGACCSCGTFGRLDNPVRNIMMLHFKAPVPGTGWGCMVCHIPLDGASAVICDQCLKLGLKKRPIRFVIKGYATNKERAPIEECTEPFDHIMELHRDEYMELEYPGDDQQEEE